MLASACAILFIAAAICSAGAIALAFRTHGEDLRALRALRGAPERARFVSWRLVETGAVCVPAKAPAAPVRYAPPQSLAA